MRKKIYGSLFVLTLATGVWLGRDVLRATYWHLRTSAWHAQEIRLGDRARPFALTLPGGGSVSTDEFLGYKEVGFEGSQAAQRTERKLKEALAAALAMPPEALDTVSYHSRPNRQRGIQRG